jgi:hypothetical protein
MKDVLKEPATIKKKKEKLLNMLLFILSFACNMEEEVKKSKRSSSWQKKDITSFAGKGMFIRCFQQGSQNFLRKGFFFGRQI